MRILTAADVRAAVDMPLAIALMRDAFAQLAQGSAIMPERTLLRLPERDASVLVMPAYLPHGEQLALKVVGVFPGNGARGLPTVPATVLLLDGATGLPLALLEGTTLTALRTGAVTGLATDLLARSEARVLTLFGAGGQAPDQLEAVCRVRHIERAWLISRNSERADRLAARVATWPAWRPAEVRVARTPAQVRAAVREADVIVTATPATEPLFAGEWVRPGTHVNAIGAFTPVMRELDSALLRRALLVVDQRAAALAEAGDLLCAIGEGALDAGAIHAELGELVLGSRPGRTDSERITCFKAVGLAVQDVAVAAAVNREAARLGLGIEVDLSGA
ncbi:MAG TPA: hypothetical protein VGN32_12295 [Ktedonobacterales bacterium]|nr:hypothetical protein [Ktedonobacterales bacterium]